MTDGTNPTGAPKTGSALRRLSAATRGMIGQVDLSTPTAVLKRFGVPALIGVLGASGVLAAVAVSKEGIVPPVAGSNLHCTPDKTSIPVPGMKATQVPISTLNWLPPEYSIFGQPLPQYGNNNFRLYLNLRDKAGAEAVARAVSDPNSPDYKRYITPQQFHECFSPGNNVVGAISAYYAQYGVFVNQYNTPDNRSYLEFSGTNDSLNQAFGIQLYVFNIGPIQRGGPDVYLQLPLGEPQIPQAFDKYVATENGLDKVMMTPPGGRVLPQLKIDNSIPSPALLSHPTVLAALHLTMQQVIAANNTPAGKLNAHLRSLMTVDIGAHTNYQLDRNGESSLAVKPSAEHGAAPPPPAYVTNPNDCSHYWGENMATDQPPATPNGPVNPKVICGYTPQQIQTAYGLDKFIKAGIDGTGVRVAIIDAGDSPTIASDTSRYFSEQGLPQFKPGQFVDNGTVAIRNAPNAPWGLSDWQVEQALDIEAVHSMAPGATIVYQPALDPTDWNMQQAVNTVVDKHSADIVSNSWSTLGELPLAEVTAFENDFVQAATEGISELFATGDSRDNAPNGFIGPNYQSTSPWVTAVGGTSLGVGANGERLWETPWGTIQVPIYDGKVYTWGVSASSGAGGGTSQIFAEPWYQKGPGPNGQPSVVQQTQQSLGVQLTVASDGTISDAKMQYMRSASDVSMVADPNTGFIIGSTQTYPDGSVHYVDERIGGTSLATPLWAGVLAVASQRHGAVGFANPALYAADHNNPALFNDVTGQEGPKVVVRVNYANGIDDTGGYDVSLRFLGYDFTLLANPGYDQPTGIGTPTGELIKELGG